MIVQMKKITLLLSAKHRDAALKALRKFGVLHVHDVKVPVSEDIQFLETKIDDLDKALLIINAEDVPQEKADNEQAVSFVEQILSQTQQMDVLDREKDEYSELHKWYQTWGAISYSSIQKLKEAGIHVRLYTADKNAVSKLSDDKIIHIAKEDQSLVYFALFSESEEDRLEFKEEIVPQVELADVESRLSQIKKDIENIENTLKDLSRYNKCLLDYKAELEKHLELNRVKYGMGEDGPIAYLNGFCPNETVTDLKKMADKEGWAYIIEEPDNPEEVPTLIKNPKWLRMIQPVFDFMGTLPGYHEQDVSFVFLAFFTIFFAMLVGDGGYGVIFLTLTILLSRKMKNGSREVVSLLYLLSIATIIWGLVTGNWFGAEAIVKIPILSMFVVPQLYTYSDASAGIIMQLSFMIGVTQLCVAHLLAAAKKRKSMTMLADLGWVILLVAVFFIANNLILKSMGEKLLIKTSLPEFTVPLFIAGSVLVLLFANFQKNIIKGILVTIGNLPLDVIGSFSDIVSYIRLFAVGLASFIVANSFNSIAIGEGINSVIGGIVAAIILFLAHALNIVLCGMSVLVHGVRLNMLEFSGHVGVQWSGKPYKPFTE